jgi:uncharacterized protein (TIGR04255 family)
MPPGQYARPPITEAVIEIRFDPAVTQGALAKFVNDVRGQYPTVEQGYDVTVELKVSAPGAEPVATPRKEFAGYKITGREGTDLILLSADRLATVRLAPYCGWEQFLETAKNNYALLKKRSGYRKIVRVATRYINRIDIPVRTAGSGGDTKPINTIEYLLAEPRVPKIIPNINNFSSQFEGVVPEIDGKVIVNTATAPSPLIDHVSLLLDMDLFKDQNLPQKDDELWDLLAAYRKQKNMLFEAFITDRARGLFDRD